MYFIVLRNFLTDDMLNKEFFDQNSQKGLFLGSAYDPALCKSFFRKITQ